MEEIAAREKQKGTEDKAAGHDSLIIKWDSGGDKKEENGNCRSLLSEAG